MKKRKRITADPEPMSDEAIAACAAARVRRQADEAAARVAKMADATAATAWRRHRLDRYVRSVLALAGRDRLAYMDANPIGGLFT